MNVHTSSRVPVVSVVIPAYNSAAFIRRSVESVLAQTLLDFELIIVNDGSSDATADIIGEYQQSDARVHSLNHPRNLGLPAARNTGIRNAQADLLAFLDSDDWWASEKLAVQVRAFQDPQVGASALGAYHVFSDERRTLQAVPACNSPADLYRTLLFGNAVPGSASSVMVRRRCFDQVGLFDESMVSAEDLDMWARLALHCHFVFDDTALVFIDRTRPDSMGKNLGKMADGIEVFLHKQEETCPPEIRSFLAPARRYVYLNLAMRAYQVAGQAEDLRMVRRFARKALTVRASPNREMRRSAILYLLSFIPISEQRRWLSSLRRRYLKREESDAR